MRYASVGAIVWIREHIGLLASCIHADSISFCIHTYIHTHTYICIYIFKKKTHTHTHTYIYIYIYLSPSLALALSLSLSLALSLSLSLYLSLCIYVASYVMLYISIDPSINPSMNPAIDPSIRPSHPSIRPANVLYAVLCGVWVSSCSALQCFQVLSSVTWCNLAQFNVNGNSCMVKHAQGHSTVSYCELMWCVRVCAQPIFYNISVA